MKTRGVQQDFNELLNPFSYVNEDATTQQHHSSEINKWTCSVCGITWLDHDQFKIHVAEYNPCANTPQNNLHFFTQKRQRTTEQVINDSHYTRVEVQGWVDTTSNQVYTSRDVRLRNITASQRIQNLAQLALPRINENILELDQEIGFEIEEEESHISFNEMDEDVTNEATEDDVIPTDVSNIKKLDELLEVTEKHQRGFHVDNNLFILTILEQVLREENASLKCFERVQDWFQRFGREMTLESVTSRKKLYKTLEGIVYHNARNEFKPRSKIIELPSGGVTNLRYFSPVHCIFSLLNDGRINAFENTIFKYTDHESNHTKNPFYIHLFRNWFDDKFSDIETSYGYMMIYKKQMEKICQLKSICLEQAMQEYIICPYLMFIDATTISRSGSSSLEPFLITLGIFDQATRNSPSAWRHIAFNPIIQDKVNELNSLEKQEDYHRVLRELIGLLTDDFEDRYYSWQFTKLDGSKLPMVHIKFVPMVIIGDTEGGDKLCGRYLSNNCNSLTRDCNILTEDSDDPFAECNLNLHEAMNDLKLDDERMEELQSRSFSKIDSFAFAENIFDSPMGIYGATPVEPLHLIYGGIADRVFECFEKLLGKEQYKKLDSHASILSGYYSRQHSSSSFRLISRFHKGLKLKGTMSSREKVDRIFLVYLVLLCPTFPKYLELKKSWKQGVAFSRDDYDLWVHLFERTVIYCRWVCLDEYPCKLFVGRTRSVAYRCIQNYLSLLKQVGDRRKGNGFKIPKFHLNLHVPFYITMYGSPNVVTTETTERHHVQLTKKPARNTQQRDSTIIEQATSRVYEKNILDTFIEKKTCVVEAEEVDEEICAVYDLYLDYNEETCIFKWKSQKYERECRRTMPSLLLKQIFGVISAQKCSSANKQVYKITGCTSIQYRTQGESKRIRSNPWFYNDQWFDWITYQWEQDDGGTLPCKVYALLDFSSYEEQTSRQPRVGWSDLNEREGIHMLVHSASSMIRNKRSSVASSIDSKLAKEYEMESSMQMIPFVSEKIEPVFCVQDWDGIVLGGVPTFNMIPNRNNVLALQNVDDWNEVFVNTLKTDPIAGSETYSNSSFRPNLIIENMKRRGIYNKEDWGWEDIHF